VVVCVAVALGLATTVWLWKKSPSGKPNESSARFAGSASCEGCHAAQYSQWLESNHSHAMEIPSATSVLGNFNNAEFRYFGRTTRFFKDGDSFRIITENQQGAPESFRIAYTLGYKPLQQYLVDVGGGRIQVLPFAWDTRGAERWRAALVQSLSKGKCHTIQSFVLDAANAELESHVRRLPHDGFFQELFRHIQHFRQPME